MQPKRGLEYEEDQTESKKGFDWKRLPGIGMEFVGKRHFFRPGAFIRPVEHTGNKMSGGNTERQKRPSLYLLSSLHE